VICLNALLLLLHEPWHADAFVLSGKVGAGELLVAAVGRFLATTVHHAVLLVTIQEWQPGCANSLLVGTPDAVELLVAALDGVAAAFEMGALFVFNGRSYSQTNDGYEYQGGFGQRHF